MEASAYVSLKSSAIYDLPSFHAECQRALGFGTAYAGTLEAWIDAMSAMRGVDGPDARVGVHLPVGEMLQLEIPDLEDLRERAPDVVEALVAATAFVNQGYISAGQAPAIALIFS